MSDGIVVWLLVSGRRHVDGFLLGGEGYMAPDGGCSVTVLRRVRAVVRADAHAGGTRGCAQEERQNERGT